MKRVIVIIVIALLIGSVVLAESGIWYYPELDWFSKESAENAAIPAGLSDREAEIYRAGFANGHYDALNPSFIEGMYVLNTKTKKFHLSNCMTTLMIESEHREHSYQTPLELMAMGYKPCGQCNPERDAEPDGD